MRIRVVWGVVTALAVVALVPVLGVLILRPLSVVHPVPELRSYGPLPTVLAAPAFYAGPIASGNVLDQQVRLSDQDVAVRLWLGPALEGARARARIELLAGPHGPSLRSGMVDLPARAGSLVARVLPPLRPSELDGDGLALLRVTPTDGSQPIRVGMAQGTIYQPERAYIAGKLLPEDQDVMFEVARRLSPDGVWSQVWTLIDSETLPVRVVAAIGPIVLIVSLAAGMAARGRRARVALAVAIVAVAAAVLVVVDRTPVTLFPWPDFNPAVILR